MSSEPTMETLQADALEETGPDPAAQVLGWRIEQLIAVGFDSDAALLLALDRNVDLHQASKLVRCGCPPSTAFRILI